MEETPIFELAVERFQRFLGEQGWPSKIVWREVRDIVRLRDGKIVVRRRSARDAEHFARSHYEDGRQSGVGVALEAACEVDDSACTTIYWTSDSTEAQYRMMPESGLKLGVVTHRPRGREVGMFRWWLAMRRTRRWESALCQATSARAAQPGVEPDGPSARGLTP